MQTQFRTVTLSAFALAVLTGTATAQTLIETERPAVVRPAPLSLSQAQRTTIYRTIVPRSHGRKPIVHERIVTETVGRAPPERVVRVPQRVMPQRAYVIGDRIPADVELAPVPEEVVTEVPEVSCYKYMVINDRLFLVDPVTSTVVSEIEQ